MGPRPSQGFVHSVNLYLLAGPPVTLVDAGMPLPECVAALEAALGAEGHHLADVEQIVITHTHPDHYGGAGAIVSARAALGAGTRILAHPRAAPILANLGAWWARLHAFRLETLRQAGAPAAMIEAAAGAGALPAWMRSATSPAGSVAVDAVLPDGARLETGSGGWQAIHTPGHATTQLCLLEPESGVLLSSDHLLPSVSANMVLEPPGEADQPALVSYLDSLRRLQALPLREVWPGHGDPAGSPQALIAERIERCERRLGQAAAAVGAGAITAWDVASALYAGTDVAGSARALTQTVAYLDALVAQGRLDVQAEHVPRVYRVPIPRRE